MVADRARDICRLACFVSNEALSNLFSLLTADGYFIPSQSSIFTFRTTVGNPGSGEWWLCGEDASYFYALPDRDEVNYLAFPKAKLSKYTGFQQTDYKTWPTEATITSRIP